MNATADPALEAMEARLAEQPTIGVLTILLHGEADGVAPPDDSEHDASQFTARYERHVVRLQDAFQHGFPPVRSRERI